MNSFERETVINSSDGDELVRIWTAQRTYITKMRRDAAFTETGAGTIEGTDWATFTIPADRWSPLGPRRSKNLTPEQREAMSKRMNLLRGGVDG